MLLSLWVGWGSVLILAGLTHMTTVSYKLARWLIMENLSWYNRITKLSSICFSHMSSSLSWAYSHGRGRYAKSSKINHVKGKKNGTLTFEISESPLLIFLWPKQVSKPSLSQSGKELQSCRGRGVETWRHVLRPLMQSIYLYWLNVRAVQSHFNIP